MAYSPATALINANLPSTQATFYDSVAVEALFANLVMQTLATKRVLPMRSGKTIQLFGYDLAPFTANVSAGNTPPAASEGTVGTGLTPTQSKVTATLGQYVDYVSVSDFAEQIAIDPMLENLSKMLGYRASLVADTLVQMEFDAATALDALSTSDLADGSFLTANVIRSKVSSLEGQNAKPFPGGKYRGVMHPFVAGDLLNDTTNNSVVDVLKHTESGQKIVMAGNTEGSNFKVIDWAGVEWVTSTNVPLTANVPTAGKSAYSSYISSEDAVFTIGLGKTEVPKERNFQTRILRFAPSAADPGGQIAGAVSYNFKLVVAPRTGTTMTFRRIRSESAIS